MTVDYIKSRMGLLITGCVNPPENVYFLSLKDPDVRRKQYFESLEYFVRNSVFDRLIFCDNSSEKPQDELLGLALGLNKEIEWISFQGDENKCVEKGKGYGEGEIIEHALKNSRLLKSCDYFAKVTGRLIVHNIDHILEMIRPDRDIYINLFADDRNDIYADTRFYISRIDFYNRELLSLYKNVDDRKRMNIERQFGERLRSDNIDHELLPDQPAYEGFSGSSGLRICVGEAEISDFAVMRKEIIDGKYYHYKWMNHEMRIFPCDEEPGHELIKNTKLMLYGAGKAGRLFYKSFSEWCRIAHWVDRNYENLVEIYGKNIEPPDIITENDCKYVVIAIEDYVICREILENISRTNIGSAGEAIWFNGYSLSLLKKGI